MQGEVNRAHAIQPSDMEGVRVAGVLITWWTLAQGIYRLLYRCCSDITDQGLPPMGIARFPNTDRVAGNSGARCDTGAHTRVTHSITLHQITVIHFSQCPVCQTLRFGQDGKMENEIASRIWTEG